MLSKNNKNVKIWAKINKGKKKGGV